MAVKEKALVASGARPRHCVCMYIDFCNVLSIPAGKFLSRKTHGRCSLPCQPHVTCMPGGWFVSGPVMANRSLFRQRSMEHSFPCRHGSSKIRQQLLLTRLGYCGCRNSGPGALERKFRYIFSYLVNTALFSSSSSSYLANTAFFSSSLYFANTAFFSSSSYLANTAFF